jgi:hypothetical protein
VIVNAGANLHARPTKIGPRHRSIGPESSHDVDVTRVRIGADTNLDILDKSIGTQMDNTIDYSCSQVARLGASGAQDTALLPRAARREHH